VYTFFNKRVLGKTGKTTEPATQVEKPQDLLALHGRTLPANALRYEQILEQWIAASKRQSEAATDPAAMRERLALALASEWPAKVLSEGSGPNIALGREGRGDRVKGYSTLMGGARATLRVGPGGSVPETPGILLLDPFPTQKPAPVKHFLTFNHSDDANRVQDILTGLRFLEQSGYTEIKLEAKGAAAVWALFAAAVAPIAVTLDADTSGFTGTDDDFLNQFFVPGIQRAGGLKAALACAKPASRPSARRP
jgi:hypothetical protein